MNSDSHKAVNDNLSSYDFLSAVRNNPNLALQYDNFRRSSVSNKGWADRFNDYISRKKTLPLLYDPFFKKLFNGDEHRERLSRLVSSIIGQEVTVIDILPSESSSFEDSFIIMDMIVRLSDGSIANIEVQKIASLFPGERLSCYSADAIMRQYHRLSSATSTARYSDDISQDSDSISTLGHKTFSYKDMKNVHTIVLFENSNSNLINSDNPELYFHVGTTTFNTHINFPLLQKYHMISLDTFRKYRYSDIIKGNIDIKKCDYDEDVYEKPLTDQMLRDRLAFLSLFVTETVDEAIAIQNIFPELSEIFDEMNEYLARPEEVLGMFSEALRILNHNTAVLMVDEYRKKYQEMENNLKKEMKEKMQEKMQEIQEMQERENNLKKEMQERENNIKKEMQEQQKILDDKDKQINSQEEQHKKDLERIAELEAMLKESRESKESNGQG